MQAWFQRAVQFGKSKGTQHRGGNGSGLQREQSSRINEGNLTAVSSIALKHSSADSLDTDQKLRFSLGYQYFTPGIQGRT